MYLGSEGSSAPVGRMLRSQIDKRHRFWASVDLNIDETFRDDGFYAQHGKRLFDICFALVVLPFLLPALMVLLAIVAADGGKPLFRHKRMGRRGQEFYCLKIRTMKPNAEAILKSMIAKDRRVALEWAKHRKLANDPRITKIGKVLRLTSLDELPQIFNILRGDMSFVGPRPMTDEEVRDYTAKDLDFRFAYTAVRPGLTGPWQISGRRTADVGQRIAADKAYSRNMSFRTDLRIMLKTLPEVICARGR